MHVVGRGVGRSVAGRLYVALAVMLIGLVAASIQTIIYAGLVARSTTSVLAISIDDVRNADAFDEALDEHRRVVMAAVDRHDATASAQAVSKLQVFERELAVDPGLPTIDNASASEITSALQQGVNDLRILSRRILTLAPISPDRLVVSEMEDAYFARVNALEQVVTNWKKRTQAASASKLGEMKQQAVLMQRVSAILILGGCLIGGATALLSRSMLRRLKQLTRAMLSLASGDLGTDIPYCGASDEIGHLADALAVFRDNAKTIHVSETKLTAAFENMAEGVLMFSPERAMVLHNQKAVAMLNLPDRNCRDMTVPELLDHLSKVNWPSDIIATLGRHLVSAATQNGAEMFDITWPDEQSFKVMTVLLPDQHLLVSLEDTTERRASAARIEHLAHYDLLTGLPNRAMFQEQLRLAIADALNGDGTSVALLMYDLDRFKDINDSYGHQVGDELLCQVAQRMRETMRKTDIVARLGGDEFATVHLTGHDVKEAHIVAERIMSALNQPFAVHDHQISIGVSIGIARAPTDAMNLTELMKRADLALYAAKQSGRNRFMVYDAGKAERLEERRAIAMEMRQALSSEFYLCYQPQVDLRTRQILGFEALARWNHPVRGPISPATFIPVAEECGLIGQLGEWALRTACQEAAGWSTEARISVNVSPQQLHEEGFTDTVRSVLHETGLSPARLELEVTETAMLNDGERMLAVMHALHALGVQLALDDFGTGYSALSYLQTFPFDKIKIDQSFVRQLGDNDESKVIVRAIASLGANLGIPTIAEGVETEDQARQLLQASCDEGQGYLFSRPVEAEAARKLLQRSQMVST